MLLPDLGRGQSGNRDVIWVQKVGQAAAGGTGGSYLQGHFAYPAAAAAQGGMVAAAPNGMVPVYPFYHYHQYHASQGGVAAAHFFPPVSAAAVPAVVSKHTVMAAPKGERGYYSNSTQIYQARQGVCICSRLAARRTCSRCGITRAALPCMCPAVP
jgi:hypothetical protein